MIDRSLLSGTTQQFLYYYLLSIDVYMLCIRVHIVSVFLMLYNVTATVETTTGCPWHARYSVYISSVAV